MLSTDTDSHYNTDSGITARHSSGMGEVGGPKQIGVVPLPGTAVVWER